jgi:hypothetical protein
LPASCSAAVQGNWNLGKITTAAIKNWLDTPEAVANGLAARRDAELAVIRNANITFVVRWGSGYSGGPDNCWRVAWVCC